ncbi:MAG: hypothetical protein JNK27_02855, partial [Chitinophagaceae bacterium]|nr:hypothetical protein [Chitinophagaceae bacterium]
MRITLLRTLTVLGCLFILSGRISAQNCNRSTINGTTINLLCNQICTTLVFQVPHLKSTSDYIIRPITYNPYAYSTPTGNNIAGPPYILSSFFDDQWTSKIPITFPFCFYGITYPTLLIGTNSAITFDTTRALTGSGFSIAAPPTGAIPTTSYAPAMIFGPYHDIDIDQPTGPNKRIEFRIECTAPNRRFITSYSEIPFFGSSCNTNIATHQIVLYESTGIIEVYIQDKPSCTGWNGGRAILGVQDHTRLNAVAATGKNATVWNENNTAYRFIPSGGSSRYISSQILDMSGNLVVAGDTTTTTSGMLDLSFPNICVPSGSNQYQVVTTFADCANPAANYVVTDTITVARTNSIGATNTVTAATCGNNNGTITVNIPAGVGTAPFSYVLDGGAPVVTPSLTHTFTGVASGPHVVTVTDASTGCTSTLNVTVTLVGNLLANTTSTATACAAVNNNGTITVTPTVGTGPFTYVIDGGAPVTGGSPYTFTGLSSGNHTITFTDVNSCTSNPIIVNVATGAGITSHGVTSTATSCAGASNGSITVTSVTGGTAPYQYQLGAGPFQPSNVFTGLASGTYTITIRDASGCTRTFNRTVTNGSSVTATTAITAATCPGVNNGSVLVTPTNGTGPYTFLLDGTVSQTGATNTTFTGLAPGAHTILITDNPTGCLSNTININVGSGAGITASAAPAATSCNGATDGSITVTPNTGTGPYAYSLDGGAYVAGATPQTFNGLSAGAHTIRVQDANGCETNLINVTINAGPTLAASLTQAATSCSGAANGSITVTPTNGAAPYSFSIDGGAPITAAAPYTFTNLAAGTHSIVVSSGAGCTSNVLNIDVVAGPNLTTTASKTDVLCNAGATGTITVTQPTIGNPPYEYSLDNITWQGSNTFSGLIAGTYTVYYREANGCQNSLTITVSEPAVLNAVASGVAVVCNGQSNGIITVATSGGVAPYEYSIDGGSTWQPSNIFNVAAGTYTITIRDVNSCVTTQTLTVTEPPVLSAAPVNTNASCDGGNDGTITVNATGGNGSYQYSIDNGATWQSGNVFNVAPGNYTVSVRDNL